MHPDDPNFLDGHDDHRCVLRRLVEVSGDRLVTADDMIRDRSFDLGGKVYPPGDRPPQLLNLLDDLVALRLAERIVPTAGASSYRPTDLGRERLGQTD